MTWSSLVTRTVARHFESLVCKLESMSTQMELNIFLMFFNCKMVPNELQYKKWCQWCFRSFVTRLLYTVSEQHQCAHVIFSSHFPWAQSKLWFQTRYCFHYLRCFPWLSTFCFQPYPFKSLISQSRKDNFSSSNLEQLLLWILWFICEAVQHYKRLCLVDS